MIQAWDLGPEQAVGSQSIKVPAAEKREFDACKRVVGRKRHIAVDTDVLNGLSEHPHMSMCGWPRKSPK